MILCTTLLVVFILTISNIANGQAIAQAKTDAIRSYLIASQQPKRIQMFTQVIIHSQMQFSYHLQQTLENTKLLQQRSNTFIHISTAILNPKTILTRLQQRLAESLDTREAILNLEWWQSPLGQKIAKAQNAASSAQSRHYIDVVSHHPEILNNAGYVQYITMVINASQQLKLAQYFGTSMVNISHLLSADHSYHKQLTPQFRQNINTYVLAINSYIYRHFSSQELQQYIDYLNSPYGRKVTVAYRQTIEQSLSQLSAALQQRQH